MNVGHRGEMGDERRSSLTTKKPAKIALNLDALAKQFALLGARNPTEWARSQVEEGVPQLARFLFLRQAWNLVVAEDDATWTADMQASAKRRPSDPGAAAGPALERLLAQGARAEDITTVVRVMQWRMLASLCYLLDDPGTLESDVEGVAWGLFQLDQDEQPVAAMRGLHESVLEADPTGREMRPADGTQPSKSV